MFFRLFFIVFPLTVWAALLAYFVRPLRLRVPGRAALSLLLLAATQKFVWFALSDGDSVVPEWPLWLLDLSGWAYSGSVMLFGLLLLPPWRHRTRRRLLLLALAAYAVSAWGLYEGRRIPSPEEREIVLRDLPPAFDGFRIVHLSDLHASPGTTRAHFEGVVDVVNALVPDLVCITGDFADGTPEKRGDQLEPLARIRATYGVAGCPGNHEYYGPYGAWRPLLESYGVHMLDNASFVITNGAAYLAVGGVTDPAAVRSGHPVYGHAAPDASRAFAGVPADACRILLRHRPVARPEEPPGPSVALQLSGHTHGGAILGLDLLVRAFNGGRVRGLYGTDTGLVHVSPGTGQWAGFPMRLGVPSRITCFVLHAPSAVVVE